MVENPACFIVKTKNLVDVRISNTFFCCKVFSINWAAHKVDLFYLLLLYFYFYIFALVGQG